MANGFTHIRLASVASTNAEMKSQASQLATNAVISAVEQTAGRGQRGNTWEASPEENVTMSMLLRPRYFKASEQFYISQIVAVAVADAVRGLLLRASCQDVGDVGVKWPNDVYVGDRKICGILIENSLSGHGIQHSIAGIGVNVNQREFLSDAPNPVSLYQLTGMCWDVEEVIELITDGIVRLMDLYDREGADMGQLQREYGGILWRREGFHPYIDNIAGEAISAAIDRVAPDGMLTLRLADGSRLTYAFKEVAAVI